MILLPQLRDYKRWRALWPESNSYIRKFHLSLLNKIIFFLAYYKFDLLASALQGVKVFIKKIF